jgi:hypothetical protein
MSSLCVPGGGGPAERRLGLCFGIRARFPAR